MMLTKKLVRAGNHFELCHDAQRMVPSRIVPRVEMRNFVPSPAAPTAPSRARERDAGAGNDMNVDDEPWDNSLTTAEEALLIR